MKILSPAGNFESLKMAVYYGADEVYLGINNFNARNNIEGFTMESLEEAVDFAHVFGVKVNLAINILFGDDELQGALDTIVDSYNLGVDSFIIQDLGLASLVHENYPEIEIHASTQMGIHNLEGVRVIQKYGFKRVVLARETPLEEIKRIRENSDIEIEYFAQGALCVAFSGNCYLSSYLCDASGNRGKCKQLCRLPYRLEFNNKILKKGFLLSAKDFNVIDRLDDLKGAGVDVIKIEGRARRPFYVAMATKEYYDALRGKKSDSDNLKLAFNRGYTEGYFNGNGNIISNYNNHIGVEIGRITNVKDGRKFNEVFFSSNRELSPKSTFKLYKNHEEKNTLTAFDLINISRGKYKLTTTQKVNVGDSVHLIVDAKLEEDTLKFKKKRKIKIEIFAKVGEKIKAEFQILEKRLEIEGVSLVEAENQPLSNEEIVSNFKKNDRFDFDVKISVLDKVFITRQALNGFRRCVVNAIENYFIKNAKHSIKRRKICIKSNNLHFNDFEIVADMNKENKSKNIIFSPEIYDINQIKLFQEKCKKEKRNLYLDLPNFALEKDIVYLKNVISETGVGVVVNNYYALDLTDNYILGAGFNVYNSVTAREFNRAYIVAENGVSSEIKYPYMTLRHCPMKSHLNASCDKCPYKDGFIYRMDNGLDLKLKRKKISTCTFYLI